MSSAHQPVCEATYVTSYFMYNNNSDTSNRILAFSCAIFVHCGIIHNGYHPEYSLNRQERSCMTGQDKGKTSTHMMRPCNTCNKSDMDQRISTAPRNQASFLGPRS